MRSRLETLLIAVFLVGSVGLLAWFNLSKPRILILHSYDQGYSWVKDVNAGIRRVLDQRGDYTVRWYYLDTKRHPWPDFKDNAGLAARRMIDEMQPEVILAVDDDAQNYVSRHYLNHPHIRIVFAGVNNAPGNYGFDRARNVSGILERLPLDALKETLLIAAQRGGLPMPMPLRIRFIGDRSETVLGDEKTFSGHDWSPFIVQPSRLVDTWPEWQQAVAEAATDTDVLITSNYRKLLRATDDPRLLPPAEVIGWTEAHARPFFIGTNAFFAEDGGMLAIGTSPYEQGEVAARLAVEAIDAIPQSQPMPRPFSATRQFVVALRGSALHARHFNLPRVYEASARASNKYFE
ncbi:MAG: hypothetical protein KBD60_00050 [Sterolibacterium sp.]|jgi:hypothetical protein|nr:hypothetical protein [Sterolibacterium sp.]